MLKRVSGKWSSRSAILGIGSLPADQGRRQVDVRRLDDAAGAGGDPVEDVVVEGQQHAVAGGVDVGLEVAVAERHRVLERRAGCSRGPAMSGCRAPPRWANASTAPSSRPASRNGKPGVRTRHARSITGHGSRVAANRAPRHPRSYSARPPSGGTVEAMPERDDLPAVPVRDAPRVPRDVTVHQCASCQGVFLERADLGNLIEAENDWHRDSGPKTQPLPRITADMTRPRRRARSPAPTSRRCSPERPGWSRLSRPPTPERGESGSDVAEGLDAGAEGVEPVARSS